MKKIGIAFLVLFIMTAALSFIPIGGEDPEAEMEIYLLSNPIHTDIAVPLKNQVFNWETFLDPANFTERPSEWLELGWGDRQFYFEMPTWDRFTFKLAADALFLPDQAVMHVTYLDHHPAKYESARKIKISFKTYAKLVENLKQQFVLKDNKPVLIAGKGYYGSDNFYEAHGSYSIIRTCNIWTAQMLGSVGLKRPIWSPFKYGLEFVWDKN